MSGSVYGFSVGSHNQKNNSYGQINNIRGICDEERRPLHYFGKWLSTTASTTTTTSVFSKNNKKSLHYDDDDDDDDAIMDCLMMSSSPPQQLARTSRRDVFYYWNRSAVLALGAMTSSGWMALRDDGVEPPSHQDRQQHQQYQHHFRPPSARAVLVTDPSEPPRVSTADSISSFVQGTVTIPDDFDVAKIVDQMTNNNNNNSNDPLFPSSRGMPPVPALYITVRPDRPDNVPKAILEGSRGKPPPVLSARFEQPTFPFAFHLTSADYTLEGAAATTGGTSTTIDDDEQQQQQPVQPWWSQDDLIVSARLDMDGIAATRSPDDLVGRAVYQRKKGGESVTVALTGRGAFGKFATGGK